MRSRKDCSLCFLRVSIKNGHPFIYFTPFFEKTEYVTIHFFNNGKVQLTLYSLIECFHENIILNSDFECSFKNIMEIVEEKIFSHFPQWLYLKEIEFNNKYEKKFYKIVRRELVRYLVYEVLISRNLDGIFINGGVCDKIHFKNYKTDDFGVVYLGKSGLTLYKKDISSEYKVIEKVELSDVLLHDRLMISFLDKRIKNLKTKIYKYF